jgi:hypothetical protein
LFLIRYIIRSKKAVALRLLGGEQALGSGTQLRD